MSDLGYLAEHLRRKNSSLGPDAYVQTTCSATMENWLFCFVRHNFTLTLWVQLSGWDTSAARRSTSESVLFLPNPIHPFALSHAHSASTKAQSAAINPSSFLSTTCLIYLTGPGLAWPCLI